MKTGTLTPRSNNCVEGMRFSGDFGQPDGFGSVLAVRINEAGQACFALTYKNMDGSESSWAVTLTDSQRDALAVFLAEYKPRLFERYQRD